ncbi:MAG: HypC/HybG/HupF family hydrogenase formation chaperone [Chloroflexota bacterium]|nr:MAG: HypC/HybG/HupF family hydrogenase formation chaperone [Chloroflexota bacterium]
MCLSIPVKIVRIGENGEAEAEIGGVRRPVSLTFVPEARVGDYVLMHVGYAIQRLDETAAQETLALLAEAAQIDAAEVQDQ